MNFLKSLFISAYMMATMAITMVAAIALRNGADYVAWGGVLLVAGPFLLVISWLMISRSRARTSAHFPLLNALGAIGVALTAWGFFRGAGVTALMLSTAGWIAFLFYAYWYSRFGRHPSNQLAVGQTLPEFGVFDVQGQRVTSSSLTDKAAIWMFYRGNWCPLCMAQIKELAAKYKLLDGLEVRVALISPQPHKNTIALAKKYGVKFEFLADEGNRAARALGIANPYGAPMGMQMMGYDTETVLPTVIISDVGGRILWVDETDNYRVRPEPETFLEILREARLNRANAPSARCDSEAFAVLQEESR